MTQYPAYSVKFHLQTFVKDVTENQWIQVLEVYHSDELCMGTLAKRKTLPR